MGFSPFGGKSLAALTESDLRTLVTNGVAEGYTVEYKREPVSNAKLSHSLASLANTNGGWYIVGVVTDDSNVAVDVPGHDFSGGDYLSTVRDVVTAHIGPALAFEARLIDLERGTSVLVVSVPDRQATPFITSDGRVYRRSGDSSTPVPEKDRHSFDRLVDLGREPEKALLLAK